MTNKFFYNIKRKIGFSTNKPIKLIYLKNLNIFFSYIIYNFYNIIVNIIIVNIFANRFNKFLFHNFLKNFI